MSYFHIYNHANGDDNLFCDDGNYIFFLQKMKKYLAPNLKLMAYCLMPNHFHFLTEHTSQQNESGKAISNLFNSYSKSFNKLYKRRGSLFIKNYKKKELLTRADIRRTILYIHRNPIHHGFTSHYSKWLYSSYHEIMSNETGLVQIEEVLNIFNGLSNFIKEHEEYMNKPAGFLTDI